MEMPAWRPTPVMWIVVPPVNKPDDGVTVSTPGPTSSLPAPHVVVAPPLVSGAVFVVAYFGPAA
jgi:hypothetical protein